MGETFSGELFVGRNYSSGEIFVTKRKIRQFRPTKSFARRKISPVRIFCTKVSSVLNGPYFVLSKEVLWKWLFHLCDSWHTQNSRKLEGSYSPDKSHDWVNLPQFVWGTVFASHHSFKKIYQRKSSKKRHQKFIVGKFQLIR